MDTTCYFISIRFKFNKGLSGVPILCSYDKQLPYEAPLSQIPHTVATTPRRSGQNIWNEPKNTVPLHQF